MADRLASLKSYSIAIGRQKPFVGPYPFEAYDDRSLEVYDRNFHNYPNRRGILADYYRDIFELTNVAATKFVRFEAHLNITHSTQTLSNHLLELGFEPDDFEELYPELYTRNFTFAFDVPRESDNRSELKKKFIQCCKAACNYLEEEDGMTGFLEAEIIPSSNFYRFPLEGERCITALPEPFPPDTLIRSYFAETDGDAQGEPIGTAKKSDIHVKFLGRTKSTDRVQGRISTREQFVSFLEEAGFYRIVSVSGNTIYTAQFIEGGVGEDIYKRLRAFILKTGFADSIVIEPCAYFWRKSLAVNGQRRFARVSPIVKRRSGV